METVEFTDIYFTNHSRIETSGINAVSVRVRTWDIERFNSADSTKLMVGGADIKSVMTE